MIETNNRIPALIAYGSYAPGGENHARLAFFAGEWRKGFVLGTRHTSDDDIGPGDDLIDAWVLEFPRPQADPASSEYEAWAHRLSDLWMGLDKVMGETMVRDSRQWCPRDSSATDDSAGMVIANIYLPRDRFAELSKPDEQMQPDDENDLETLWRQVFAGEAEHDQSHFIALIKDAHPDDFDRLFGDLPDGGRFLERLKRLFADHQLVGPSMLTPGGENYYFYVYPLARNARSQDDLLELSRQDIAQRAGFLRACGHTADAEALENLVFVTGKPDDPEWEDAGDAMEAFTDELRHSGPTRDDWHYCLKEACYGIAADYVLQDWLMLSLLQPNPPQPKPRSGLKTMFGLRRDPPPLDLEPAYDLWKAGGRYEIDGKKCCVYEVERREG